MARVADAWKQRESEYDRLCRELDEDHAAEYEMFKDKLRAEGVEICLGDDFPCNMAFSKLGMRVCAVVGGCGNVWYCGRIRFKGGRHWNLMIAEKVEKQGLLVLCSRKEHSVTCFWDEGVCGSDKRVRSKLFGNGCVVHLVDKEGFGSCWYCSRIRFCGGMSIADKVKRQRLLCDVGGE